MATPLFAQGLRELLAVRLRFAILLGRFRELEDLHQNNVSALFGVSRTTVQQGLIQLKQEGLVESTGNCGLRVTSQASEAHHEFLWELRRAVEVYALRHCIDRLTACDLARLYELVERMKAPCVQRDYVALAELEAAFQCTIVEKPRLPGLLTIWTLAVGAIRSLFRESCRIGTYRALGAIAGADVPGEF